MSDYLPANVYPISYKRCERCSKRLRFATEVLCISCERLPVADPPTPRDIPAAALHGQGLPDGGQPVQGLYEAIALGFSHEDAMEVSKGKRR